MKLDIINTDISGCFELLPLIRNDNRGSFIKTFQEEVFKKNGLDTNFIEEYYTRSVKEVLRGLHFQVPPHDLVKLVYCVEGEVLDVVVDLRMGSHTFGRFQVFTLSSHKANMIYIPRGLAHGFYVKSETATLIYKVTAKYSAECDTGILWNSIDIPWPNPIPILSERDKNFVKFQDFSSPFMK